MRTSEIFTVRKGFFFPEALYFISGAYLLGNVLYQGKSFPCAAGVVSDRSLSSVLDKYTNWLRSIKLSTVPLYNGLFFLLNHVE